MEKFGDRVGVNKSAISRIEKGVNGVTDQMFKFIVSEFNVSEEWLRDGEGEMFRNSDITQLGERVKTLRKQHLNLSQNEFGNILGVSRDVIANIELNRLSTPLQNKSLLKLICIEFNVNEEWLKSGNGEIFKQSLNVNDYDDELKLLHMYRMLNDKDKGRIEERMSIMLENYR